MDNVDSHRAVEQASRAQIVIFTDLDGTLLDHGTYSYLDAAESLQKIKETKTPLVFVTSKNIDEVASLQSEMGIYGTQPFVVKNGHAIFIPKTYFSFDIKDVLQEYNLVEKDGFLVVELGMSFKESKHILSQVSDELGIAIHMQSDMSSEEFSSETGLTRESAERALRRRYQEGFTVSGTQEEKIEKVMGMEKGLESRGFGLTTGGRYNWMLGGGSKGKAVGLLEKLFMRQFSAVTTVGIGDAPNDLEFIEHCEKGYLVANPKKVTETTSENVEQVDLPGPQGWNSIVNALLSG